MAQAKLSFKDVNLKVLTGKLAEVKDDYKAGHVSRDVLKHAAEKIGSDGKEATEFRAWLNDEVLRDPKQAPREGDKITLKARRQKEDEKDGVAILGLPFQEIQLHTIGVKEREEEVDVLFAKDYVLITRKGQKSVVTVETFEDPPPELVEEPKAAA
jgi:hypothetical protein